MKRRLPMKLMVYTASAFNLILFRPAEWLVRRFSSVGQQPFFAPSEFDWIPRIECRWTAIRDEVRALLGERGRIPSLQEVSSGELLLTQDDQWKTYWLYAYGRKLVENCRCCPETTRLIEAIPGMK